MNNRDQLREKIRNMKRARAGKATQEQMFQDVETGGFEKKIKKKIKKGKIDPEQIKRAMQQIDPDLIANTLRMFQKDGFDMELSKEDEAKLEKVVESLPIDKETIEDILESKTKDD